MMNNAPDFLKRALHPYLFALLAPLLILSQNSLEVAPFAALRTIVISLLIVFLLTRLLRRLPGTAGSASSLIVTLAIGHFYLYGRLATGNVHGLLRNLVFDLGLPGRPALTLLTTLLLFVLATFAVLRLAQRHETVTLFLNVVGLSLLTGTAFGVVRFEWQLHQPLQAPAEPIRTQIRSEPTDAPLPDIYYIVLDGYGRQDVLWDLYGLDNTPFLTDLEDLGFTVANNAHSNYMQTSLSLASTLNFNYLHDLLPEEPPGGDPRLATARLTRDSSLQRILQAHGYTFIAFESGYRPGEMAADHVLHPARGGTNLFERLIIENSALRAAALFPAAPDSLVHPGYGLHRERVLYSFTNLPQPAEATEGPLFVYAHLLVPHPPFVFDGEGRPRQPDYPYVLLDGSAYPGESGQYRRLYGQQLQYTNGRLGATLRELLERPGPEPIILIHGDHGPGSQLDWESLENTNLRERFGILLAYRFPGEGGPSVPAVRSPVNLFRVLLNDHFSDHFPPLPDLAYYSTWENPIDFVEVPARDLEIPSE